MSGEIEAEPILRIEIPYKIVKALQKSLARIPLQYMDEPLTLLLSAIDDALEEVEDG